MTTIFIQVISGLGMFLFGMLYMELALKEAAGIKFKYWIKNSTSTPLRSLLTGAGTTALLQSSSLVTLLTLSFVSTSLITLRSSIAVIFGANLGTTATAWIVAILGFKVNIETFALPMIGVGGLLLVFAASEKKLTSIAKVFIGFGLLFLGLDIMKTAIESSASSIDLSLYTHLPIIGFVSFGFLITALIQSSSATTAIVLSALYAHILNFEQSAAMVIGANMGTTVTAILGAIGEIPDKKRTAVAHFLFNFFTGVLAFLLLPFLTYVIMQKMGLKDDPTVALALFHTLFNLLGVIILTPFIPWISNYLGKMFIQKEPVSTKYLHTVDPKLPDTAFIALRNEISNLFIKIMKYTLLLSHIKPNDVFSNKYDSKSVISVNQTQIEFDYHKAYKKIKEIEFEIVTFANTLTQQNLTLEQSQNIEMILHSVRESVYAAKILKDIKNNFNEFSESDNKTILQIYDEIRKNIVYAMIIFVNHIQGDWSQEKCIERFAKAEEENHKITHEIIQSFSSQGIKHNMVSSLLNTNRSVFLALQSLLDASNAVTLHFPLEDEDTF
jgi:phosphate:Na+ symporter